MAVDHSKGVKKKASGGRRRAFRGKRRHHRGNLPTYTIIGKKNTRRKTSKGKRLRTKTLSIEFANVMDAETHKAKKVKIITTNANRADRNFARRNILTKGAEIETEMGHAIITSKPSRDGVANAILLKKEK